MPTQTEIRTSITSKIIQSLSENRIPWRKPWTGIDGPRLPTNLTTLRPYSGINVMLTWMAEQQHGWPVSYWATFNQLRSVGCHVRKGEKATNIVFWNQIKKTVTDENGETSDRAVPYLKIWNVFNISQAEGPLVEKFLAKPALRTFENVNRAELNAAVAATQAEIEFGHERAAYLRFPEDKIVMPDEERFLSFPDFATTLLHEIGHWSEMRLQWTGSYAEGELRAEIASAFMASALGIPTGDDLTNVKGYIQSWLQALENDPKYIFKAAAAASKAADFILSFSRLKSEDEADDATAAAVA
jgi:antirestriction protein ArdC